MAATAAAAIVRRLNGSGVAGSRNNSSLLGGLRLFSQQAAAIISQMEPPVELNAEQKEAWERMDAGERKAYVRQLMTQMEIARTEALIGAPAANPVFTRFADPVPQEIPFSQSLTTSETKGTKNRSIQKIEQEVEDKGAHLNAYTSREQTAYYAKVVKEDVPYAVDLFADILQNSEFDPKRVEWEKSVILREMQEVEKKRDEVLFDHLHATAFQQSSLGRTILGSADNISAMTRDQIVDYVKSHYTSSRTVISAAGAVDHNELVKLVSEKFDLPQDPTTAEDLVRSQPSYFTGSEVRIRDDDMPLARFAIAFKGASWNDADSLTLMVMQTMLGSWSSASFGGNHMGSELTQYVAANKLCHSISAFNTHYSDTGLFGLYAEAEKDTLYDLAWVCMNFMTKFVYEVEEDDLIRAKNKLKVGILQQDHCSLAAEDIGRQILTYGRRIPPEELFARLDLIDVEAVKKAANRFIYDKEIALAAIGPIDNLPDYLWLRRHTYWLRY